jgi:hypothetical protein
VTRDDRIGPRENRGGLKIVVLGYIVRGPFGGMAWHHLQYVLRFRRLGHEVTFIEDSGKFCVLLRP